MASSCNICKGRAATQKVPSGEMGQQEYDDTQQSPGRDSHVKRLYGFLTCTKGSIF